MHFPPSAGVGPQALDEGLAAAAGGAGRQWPGGGGTAASPRVGHASPSRFPPPVKWELDELTLKRMAAAPGGRRDAQQQGQRSREEGQEVWGQPRTGARRRQLLLQLGFRVGCGCAPQRRSSRGRRGRAAGASGEGLEFRALSNSRGARAAGTRAACAGAGGPAHGGGAAKPPKAYPGVRPEVAKWAKSWVGDFGHMDDVRR